MSLNTPHIGNEKELYDFLHEVTKILNNFVDAVAITINVGSSTGSSAANKFLVGGTIIACVPTGNNDQFVDNIVLNSDGSVTVTLAANATATNSFSVKLTF